MFKRKPINGWTRARIIEAIEKYVPDTPGGCRDGGGCMYKHGQDRCVIGALMSDDHAEKYKNARMGIRRLVCWDPTIRDTLPLDVDGLAVLQAEHDYGTLQLTAKQRCLNWVKYWVLSTSEDDE